MVKETFDQSLDIFELKTMIESRLNHYYPDLASGHVRVEGAFLKKHHKSMIYQFSIYNTDSILKRLIVKKRIYNPHYHNDVEGDTAHEFSVLSSLWHNSVLAGSVSRPLDAMPEKGLLITEKLEGETLYNYLKKISFLPLTKQRADILRNLFCATGKWLRAFHDAGFKGKYEMIETKEILLKAEAIIEKFAYFNIDVELGRKIREKMAMLEKGAAAYRSPISMKHGDFQPHNIMCSGDNVSVLDILARREDQTIKDVCNFITGLTATQLKLPSLSFKNRYLNQMINEYLKAYYGEREIPFTAIRFVRILGILEQMDDIYKRNHNFLRRKVITHFYNNEIKRIVGK